MKKIASLFIPVILLGVPALSFAAQCDNASLRIIDNTEQSFTVTVVPDNGSKVMNSTKPYSVEFDSSTMGGTGTVIYVSTGDGSKGDAEGTILFQPDGSADTASAKYSFTSPGVTGKHCNNDTPTSMESNSTSLRFTVDNDSTYQTTYSVKSSD